jgi:hypothetical protein
MLAHVQLVSYIKQEMIIPKYANISTQQQFPPRCACRKIHTPQSYMRQTTFREMVEQCKPTFIISIQHHQPTVGQLNKELVI